MKRSHAIERALRWHLWCPTGKIPKYVIPPRTVIRLTKSVPGVGEDILAIGDTFRIGYYSIQDGPNCVWLVDELGQYEQTWDQDSIKTYFEIVSPSTEADLFGVRRERLGPL